VRPELFRQSIDSAHENAADLSISGKNGQNLGRKEISFDRDEECFLPEIYSNHYSYKNHRNPRKINHSFLLTLETSNTSNKY
jgi:hypothetical protein